MMNDESRYEEAMKRMDREQFTRQMKEAVQLLEAGDGVAATPILERLAELYPDDIDVAINLSGAYILSKQWGRAIEVLELTSQYAPTNAAIWSNLAAAYLGTLPISTRDKQDRAIAAYKRAVELDPFFPNAHYNLGLIYEDRGEWIEARAMFTQALKVNPLDRDARTLLNKAERALKSVGGEGLPVQTRPSPN
jgi:tetratricopeptide (TPR) repeat protein